MIRWTSTCVLAIGTLVNLAWIFDLPGLNTLHSSLASMRPDTASCLVLAALGLRILGMRDGGAKTQLLGQGCAVLLLVIGFCRLGSPWIGSVRGLEFLPGMPVATALNFTLLGLALLLLDVNLRGWWPAQILALTVAAITGLAVVTTSYGIVSFVPFMSRSALAPHTLIAFVLLCAGILGGHPERGFMEIITGGGLGGAVVRRLLPAALAVPWALGAVLLMGYRAGVFNYAVGLALFAISNITVFAFLVWWSARWLNRVDVDRKRAEESLRQLNIELEKRVALRTQELAQLNQGLERRVAERTAELSRANRELQQKNQENELFVYSVSHDLRSPLVNLEGFSQELALVGRELEPLVEHLSGDVRAQALALVKVDIAESVRFIQTSVRRLSAIIDALLRLSRAGRVEYSWRELDTPQMVRRVVDALRATIDQRQATVNIQELPPLWGDALAVEQVFANLIGNALNYLEPTRPGIIEVGALPAAGPDEPHVCFVRDNGQGIPAEHQAKVFQAFKRLHPDAAIGEGMGLTIVRRIIDRHQGKIWLESSAGVGTTFFFALPGRPSPAPETPPTPRGVGWPGWDSDLIPRPPSFASATRNANEI